MRGRGGGGCMSAAYLVDRGPRLRAAASFPRKDAPPVVPSPCGFGHGAVFRSAMGP